MTCKFRGDCRFGIAVLLIAIVVTFLPVAAVAQTFLTPDAYDAGGHPFRVAVGDLNGDGKPDIAWMNFGDPMVYVLLGNGDGTFGQRLTYDWGSPGNLLIADLNGDGKSDVVVSSGTTVSVLLNSGDGTFQPAVNYDAGGGVGGVALADVNGDGKPDLLDSNDCYGGHSNCVGALLGNGDGTFQAVMNSAGCGIGGRHLAVMDLNADGKPDVGLSNSGGVCTLFGNGDGTFQTPHKYSQSGDDLFTSMAYADVNGDGIGDVILADEWHGLLQGGFCIMRGNSDGTFGPINFYKDINSLDVAVGDVTGYGYADIVTSGFTHSTQKSYGNGVVSVMYGGPHFGFIENYPLGKDTRAVAESLADLNADSKLDLVVAERAVNDDSPGHIYVLLNNTGFHSPTVTTLASSKNPAPLGQQVTFTATVTSQSGGRVTGYLTFDDDLGTTRVRLQDNRATYSQIYKSGAHTVTATYAGDPENSGSSATIIEYVGPVRSKTFVATSGSPSLVGQPVTFTATVTPKYSAIPDGGLVTFYEGKAALASVPLAGGTAAYTTSSLSAKTHTIKAQYAGDAIFKPSSGAVTQVVDKYSTTTSLSSSQNPSQSGQAVTFTSQVASSGPMPTGKVTFLDGTTKLGAVTLTGGIATLTKSKLAVGTHPITAQYLGDAYSDKSTSQVLNQVVQ
jgi:hypothetical protein